MQPTSQRPNSQSISGALARAGASLPAWPSIRGEDVGRSLAEMAQRDLDAALQLLADRAQFITGASGAAIALRRQGMKDMLCRASSGSNAPELGALLSTEFGLSGESVRTRQLLRCDDAERDGRVNHEVCRQLGIASVVVMPVVHDDEVLGVFELFSGKTNAFGERDLSAVQRLGQMVGTAVQLAHVTERLPEKLRSEDTTSSSSPQGSILSEQALEDDILEVEVGEPPAPGKQQSDVLQPAEKLGAAQINSGATLGQTVTAAHSSAALSVTQAPGHDTLQKQPAAKSSAEEAAFKAQEPVPATAPSQDDASKPAKPLLWSAADAPDTSSDAAEEDQSHVPPVLRGLRKCEACGFPISGGRVLCVECEEKKWRGQLKRPHPMPTGAIAESSPTKRLAEKSAPVQPAASSYPSSSSPKTAVPAAKAGLSGTVPQKAQPNSKLVAPEKPAAGTEATATAVVHDAAPTFALSAGLEDSPSWISANKYVIGALMLVAALIAAFFLFR